MLQKIQRIYFIREIQDEKYEIRFGDGVFGKKLGDEGGDDGKYITVEYLITDGEDGNGVKELYICRIDLKIKTGNIILTRTSVNTIKGEKVSDGVYNSKSSNLKMEIILNQY